MGKLLEGSVKILLCFALFAPHVFSLASQLESDSLGKTAKGRLGSLYNLRNKLARSTGMGSESGGHGAHVQQQSSSSARRMYSPGQQKESRGYSFHLSPSDLANPMFAQQQQQQQSYSTRDFHSRMGKVSADTSRKWKTSEKNMDKYIKYVYKVENEGNGGNGLGGVNSFNIHHLDSTNASTSSSSQELKTKVKQSTTPVPLSSTTLPSTTPMSSSKKSASGYPSSSSSLDISPIKALGQGLNSAMTTVLTQKLMGMIDQEVPQGFLNPLKHLVSSGQRMVDFWDKRANARDGKAPGIVEMFGYGIEQLKKYRDGQAMSPSDPIANLTSASTAMIQGMMVVKKLTNRVLGYNTDEATVESRGGYDHGGGYGWGHHVSYGGIGGLDPFALLAALAFGAFLLQLLLTLLNTSSRSLDVVDINVPLLMSDYHVPNIMTRMDKIFGTPTIRTRRSAEEDSPLYNSVVDKLEGMYKTYKTVSGNPSCGRLYMCRAAIQDSSLDDRSLLSQLYTVGLGQLSGDMASLSFMKSIKTRVANGEDVNCEAEVKGCSE